MAKRTLKSTRPSKAPERSRRPRLLTSGAVVLALAVGIAAWLLLPQPGHLSDAATSRGGPRLLVDKELIDLGPVRFDRIVKASFRLRNVGSQPLRLALDPQVEAIQGC
jgi:hypothetical protein